MILNGSTITQSVGSAWVFRSVFFSGELSCFSDTISGDVAETIFSRSSLALSVAALWAPVNGLDAENSSGLIEKPAVPVGGRWLWQILLEASVRDTVNTYSLCAFQTMSVIHSYVSVRVSVCYGAQKTDIVASSINLFPGFSSILQAKKTRRQWCGIVLPHSSCCWLMCVCWRFTTMDHILKHFKLLHNVQTTAAQLYEEQSS